MCATISTKRNWLLCNKRESGGAFLSTKIRFFIYVFCLKQGRIRCKSDVIGFVKGAFFFFFFLKRNHLGAGLCF